MTTDVLGDITAQLAVYSTKIEAEIGVAEAELSAAELKLSLLKDQRGYVGSIEAVVNSLSSTLPPVSANSYSVADG